MRNRDHLVELLEKLDEVGGSCAATKLMLWLALLSHSSLQILENKGENKQNRN